MNDNDGGRAVGCDVFGVRGGSGVNAGAQLFGRYLMMTPERAVRRWR